MIRLVAGLLAALLLGGAASARAATVYVATIDGMINPAVSDYIELALD